MKATELILYIEAQKSFPLLAFKGAVRLDRKAVVRYRGELETVLAASGDPDVRLKVAIVLAVYVGLPTERVLTTLAAEVESADDARRRGAVRAFSHLSWVPPPILSRLLGLLSSPQLACEALAALAALDVGRTPAVAAAVRYQLAATDPPTQLAAVKAVTKFRRPDPETTDVLLGLLSTAGNAVLRHHIVIALGAVAAGRADAARAIARQGTSDDPKIRKASARALGEIGSNHPDVIQVLIRLLGDERDKPEVRRAAADTLGKLGDDQPKVMKALGKTIRTDSRLEVKLAAGLALAGLEEPGGKAANALGELLLDGRASDWKAVSPEQVRDALVLFAHRAPERGIEVCMAILAGIHPAASRGPALMVEWVRAPAWTTLPALLMLAHRGPSPAVRRTALSGLNLARRVDPNGAMQCLCEMTQQAVLRDEGWNRLTEGIINVRLIAMPEYDTQSDHTIAKPDLNQIREAVHEAIAQAVPHFEHEVTSHAEAVLARRGVLPAHAAVAKVTEPATDPGEGLLALLNRGAKPQEISEQVKAALASPLPKFEQAFNNWLTQQKPSSYEERQEIAELIRLLTGSLQVELRYTGKPCFVTTTKNPATPLGRFSVVELGTKNRLATKTSPNDLAAFEVVEKPSWASQVSEKSETDGTLLRKPGNRKS